MSYRDEWKQRLSGHEVFRELHEELRDELRKRWNRSLPFSDELFDRWERATFLGFGEGASVYDSSVILGDVSVGRDTWIGPYTILDGSGGLSIGHHCSISSGVQIYSHDTVKWALTGGNAESEHARVEIGNCTYVGPMAIVTKGVAIGDHCVIGAASLVNRDVPERSIVQGTPARVVGHVEIDGDDVRLIRDP